MDQLNRHALAAAATMLLAGLATASPPNRWSPRPRPLTPTAAAALPADPLGDAAERQHLADQVVQQLGLAHQSARMGADQTARRAAVEALRAIAVIRDEAAGATVHTDALQVAMTAVREAGDFADRFGRVDAEAVRRLVAVHQTPGATRLDTARLTPSGATTAYLAIARGRLVFAAGGGPLGAEAVSILANLAARQHRLSTQGDAPAAAAAGRLAADVSLMYRRAAADIDPANAAVVGRLGRSLLQQSLAAAAVPVLRRSVAMQPLRENVAALANAAAMTGDAATANQLQVALATRPMPTNRPMRRLSPTQFAATGPRRLAPPSAAAEPATRTAVRPAPARSVGSAVGPAVGPAGF